MTVLPIKNPITNECLLFGKNGVSETVTDEEYKQIRKRDSKITFKTRYCAYN